MRKLLLLALCLSTASCAAPRPTVKIALVAPFEGRLRQIGYDAFPAMRLAVREAIETGGFNGYNVTFIAYNDNGDPEMAKRVAQNVALDPEVVAVIGHFVPSTTLAALNVYTQAGLPALTPGIPTGQAPEDPLVFRMGVPEAPPLSEWPEAQQALAGFSDISLSAAPTPRSVVAYDATHVLLEAIRLDAQAHGKPTREGVADALRRVNYDGLLGQIRFNEQGVWQDAPVRIHPK